MHLGTKSGAYTSMHRHIDTVLWDFRSWGSTYKYTIGTLGAWIPAAWLERVLPAVAVLLHNGD